MKTMKTARGTARAQRRSNRIEGKMAPPSTAAHAAQLADQARANRKLAVKLYHKSGEGIGGA